MGDLWYNLFMFGQILASKPKTQLLNVFLTFPERAFSLTELRLTSGSSTQILKETLKDLVKMGFVNSIDKNRVKYFQMNRQFNLYPELVGMLRKVKKLPEDLLAKQSTKLGDAKFVALTGVFVGKPRVETDILVVGKVRGAGNWLYRVYAPGV
jgi:DNA-binding HxlR family transcriptional regulator